MVRVILNPIPYEACHLILLNGYVRHVHADVDELVLVLYKKHAYWVRNLFGDLTGIRFFFVDDTFVSGDPSVRTIDCSDLAGAYTSIHVPTFRTKFKATRYLDIEEGILEDTQNRLPSYVVVVPEKSFIDARSIPDGVPHLVLDTYINPFHYIRVLEEALQVHVAESSPFVWIMDLLNIRTPATIHVSGPRLDLRNSRLKQLHVGRGRSTGD